MSTFGRAFEAGREAATKLEAANKEIDEIFGNLREDVLAATDQKVEIYFTSPSAGMSLGTFGVLSSALANAAPEPFKVPVGGAPQKLFISVKNPTLGIASMRRLATFERPFAGYPCELAYANVTDRCHDGQALISALQEMLAHPWIAKTILSVESGPAAN